MLMAEWSPEEAYLQGRLLGLSELIKVLKDAVEDEQEVKANSLAKSVIQHISCEMESILAELKSLHGEERFKDFEEMHEDLKARTEKQVKKEGAEALKQHVEESDDLMQNLIALRERNVKGER
jgi:hypothetical protein